MPSITVPGASSAPELDAHLAVPPVGEGPWPGVVVLHEEVGVTGFCMGGGFALLAASQGFDAAAPNYGHLPENAVEALGGACPIVASYGRRDPSLRGAALELERVLTEVGVDHDVKEYPDAGHSFMNRHNSGPLSVLERVGGLSYHEPSAEDAWGRILRFFEEHLR